jgi:hypothetical protein
MAGRATPLNVNDILELSLVCSQAEQIGLNVLGYRVTFQTGAGESMENIGTELDLLIHNAYKAILANTAEYYGSMIRRVWPTKTAYATTNLNRGDGTAGDEALPRQAAGMFTKTTGLPGPAGRGRFYASFPAEDDNDPDGIPTAGYMVNLGTLAGILATTRTFGVAPDTTTVAPVILDRLAYPGSLAWDFATARQKWATHRSRGSYGRANSLPF